MLKNALVLLALFIGGVYLSRPAPVTVVTKNYVDGTGHCTQELDSEGKLHGYLRNYNTEGNLVEEFKFEHGQWVSATSINPK